MEKVQDPELVTALKRWYQLCGQGGLYQREELGFGPLVGAPEILNGRSSVVATDADDPLNYVFAFYGDDFNVYDDRNFDGVQITYNRIIFPTINKLEKVDRLVTLSTEIGRTE